MDLPQQREGGIPYRTTSVDGCGETSGFTLTSSLVSDVNARLKETLSQSETTVGAEDFSFRLEETNSQNMVLIRFASVFFVLQNKKIKSLLNLWFLFLKFEHISTCPHSV